MDLVININRRLPTRDAGWDESKHKRADNGQFGSGGGGRKPVAGKSEAREPAHPAEAHERASVAHREAEKKANAYAAEHHRRAAGHADTAARAARRGDHGVAEKHAALSQMHAERAEALRNGRTAENDYKHTLEENKFEFRKYHGDATEASDLTFAGSKGDKIRRVRLNDDGSIQTKIGNFWKDSYYDPTTRFIRVDTRRQGDPVEKASRKKT